MKSNAGSLSPVNADGKAPGRQVAGVRYHTQSRGNLCPIEGRPLVCRSHGTDRPARRHEDRKTQQDRSRDIPCASRLVGISTQVAGRVGGPVTRYALEYENRNTSNRFVLKALRQYGSDGQELQPTTFEYTKPPIGSVNADYQFPNSVVLAGRNRLGAG